MLKTSSVVRLKSNHGAIFLYLDQLVCRSNHDKERIFRYYSA